MATPLMTVGDDEPGRSGRVQSVDRACLLLNALAAEPMRPQSALELARATGLNRTVAHRLLRTLAQNDLVAEAGGRYSIGSAAAVMSLAYVERLGLRQAALPYAVELHTSIDDSPWLVSLAIPATDCAILIDRFWKPQVPLASLLDLGTRLSLPGSAIGRTFLAYGHGGTPERDTDEALQRRLAAVREAGGVEWSADEIRPGLSAIAAAIRNRNGVPVGAVSISGPDLGPHLSYESELAQRVLGTAQSISRVLL
jgi:IclR family transcriptional regulator, acetate operon repressor